VIVSKQYATLHELETVYGGEDAYNFFEIISVNNYNEELVSNSHKDK
jgi:hypothetical protein